MAQETRQPDGAILIRLDGTFDAVAAWGVRGRLNACGPGEAVVLDFSQVRAFDDLGVAVLASGLASRSAGDVAVRGLRQHQMFRYFGVDLDALHRSAAAGALGALPDAGR
jgi:anti-anti-sigma regulatory factor